MNQTVIGVFDTKNQAQTAKKALVNAGFDSSYIDVSTFGTNGTPGNDWNTRRDSVTRFFDNYDRERRDMYLDVVSRGTLVVVYTDTMANAKKAAAILDRYESVNLDERYAMYSNGKFNADKNTAYLNEKFGDVNGKIEVIEEEVAIGKRAVETGGVTVRSRVIEKPIEETLRLRYEEVYVERTAVDRPVTNADKAFTGETITVTEHAEEAVVSKDARVVEEISVGKKVNERTETIRETARKTEVDIVETEGETVRKYDKNS